MACLSVPITGVLCCSVYGAIVTWCFLFFPVIVTVRGEVSVIHVGFVFHALGWQDRRVPRSEVLAQLLGFPGCLCKLHAHHYSRFSVIAVLFTLSLTRICRWL